MISGYRKNFMDMPAGLQFIWVTCLVPAFFTIVSMIPNTSLSVYGKQVPIETWWAKGGGPSVAIVSVAMCGAAWLMLTRVALARLVYAIACILLVVSIPVIGVCFNLNRHDVLVSSITNALMMSVPVLYLYLSRAVREYFGNPVRP